MSDVTRSLLAHSVKWIPSSDITDIGSSLVGNDQTIYYAVHVAHGDIMLLLLRNSDIRTPAFMNEFARIYSLPTNKYNAQSNDFRRYPIWLERRNKLIYGVTEREDNYYLVAHRLFYQCYARYGFCHECGILRCSPVWCVCGHKQLSNRWTSGNKKLDEFIKKSQIQTDSADEAYLEWIPFDCITGYYANRYLSGLPINCFINLIPLEIKDETDSSYYDKLCVDHPDILITNVWSTIGFTYRTDKQKYYLIKRYRLCLACTQRFEPKRHAFCFECKAPKPLDWTTGNKALDSFIMESWSNVKNKRDAYIQWIEYSQLTNIQAVTSLPRACTHVADWPEPTMNKLTRVTLKKIVDGNTSSFDFYQLITEYPEILTPENIWIIGVAQEPYTREYYLVFHHAVHPVVNRVVRTNKHVKRMQYTDFYDIEEIGSGGYGTVYKARHKIDEYPIREEERVVLKCYKKMPESFASEFSNHVKCSDGDFDRFLKIYGITQQPETKEYIIVMQYANDGNLLSYLHRSINNLTWNTKLQLLEGIANNLYVIRSKNLVHCDLHGGNIVLNDDISKTKGDVDPSVPFICDFGLSQSAVSAESNSIVRGVLPFIAPEVFRTCKFSRKSDIYALGIIMYLIASGEPPFRDREFDRNLVCDIMGGLRPPMPGSAPEAYKKLAEICCDDDPDKRPVIWEVNSRISNLIKDDTIKDKSDNNIWNAIYRNDVKPLSRLEKEGKYSSIILPAGDSAAVTKNLGV